MDVKLTKDADKLICLPYSEYLNALEAGIPKENARYFGSSDDIYKRLLQDTQSPLEFFKSWGHKPIRARLEELLRCHIAWIETAVNLRIGEVGLFVYDGAGYIKELGDGELISYNPEYPPIPLREGLRLDVSGRVVAVTPK